MHANRVAADGGFAIFFDGALVVVQQTVLDRLALVRAYVHGLGGDGVQIDHLGAALDCRAGEQHAGARVADAAGECLG